MWNAYWGTICNSSRAASCHSLLTNEISASSISAHSVCVASRNVLRALRTSFNGQNHWQGTGLRRANTASFLPVIINWKSRTFARGFPVHLSLKSNLGTMALWAYRRIERWEWEGGAGDRAYCQRVTGRQSTWLLTLPTSWKFFIQLLWPRLLLLPLLATLAWLSIRVSQYSHSILISRQI